MSFESALIKLKNNDADFTYLDLSYSQIYDADAQALAEALKCNTILTKLDLNWNQISAAGVQALSEALKGNTSLTELDLRDNHISAAGAQALSDMLKDNTSLTTLDLGDNPISAAGAQALSEALKSNTSLTTLYLNENQIGAAGAQALSEALKSNTSLTTLDLSWNKISAANAQALAEALKSNTSLTKLDLSWNQIGAAGAQALSEALKSNTSLTTLDLGWNQIGDAGAQALSEALKSNTSLTELDLGGNQIGAAGHLALATTLQYNYTLLDIVGIKLTKELELCLVRNRTLAPCLSAINKALKEGILLANSDTVHACLYTLQSFVPKYPSESNYLVEACRLLEGLDAYNNSRYPENQLAALYALLPPFTNQAFQHLADKTLGLLLLAGDLGTTLKEHDLELKNPLILNEDENRINLGNIAGNNDIKSTNLTYKQDNISSISTEKNQIVSEEKNEGISEGTTLKEHDLEIKGLLLQLYGFRNHLHLPEIKEFAQIALFTLLELWKLRKSEELGERYTLQRYTQEARQEMAKKALTKNDIESYLMQEHATFKNPLILNEDENRINLGNIAGNNDIKSTNLTYKQDNIPSISTEKNQIVSEEKNEGISEHATINKLDTFISGLKQTLTNTFFQEAKGSQSLGSSSSASSLSGSDALTLLSETTEEERISSLDSSAAPGTTKEAFFPLSTPLPEHSDISKNTLIGIEAYLTNRPKTLGFFSSIFDYNRGLNRAIAFKKLLEGNQDARITPLLLYCVLASNNGIALKESVALQLGYQNRDAALMFLNQMVRADLKNKYDNEKKMQDIIKRIHQEVIKPIIYATDHNKSSDCLKITNAIASYKDILEDSASDKLNPLK